MKHIKTFESLNNKQNDKLDDILEKLYNQEIPVSTAKTKILEIIRNLEDNLIVWNNFKK